MFILFPQIGHPTQVLPDFKKSPKDAKQKLLHAGLSWQRSLITALHGKDGGKRRLAAKSLQTEVGDRLGAYQVLKAIDHQLQLAGSSLSAFMPAGHASHRLQAGERRTFCNYPGPWPYAVPEGIVPQRCIITDTQGRRIFDVPEFEGGNRPMLAICSDQGGSGLPSWLFMLGHLHMRAMILPDPFHRAWRDWQLSVQSCGLWSVVLETTVALNLPHGPWLSESWFVQLQESCASYLEKSNVQDTLMPSYCYACPLYVC